MIRVLLPAHLRTLAQVTGEVKLQVAGPLTQRAVLDALEAEYPTLRGTLRDQVTGKGETTRFGGDEFMSILPGMDKAAGRVVAEQIRDAVANHVFEKDGLRVAPTISIGVSSLPEDGDAPEQLFRSADRALYRAKAAGRNQVAD